MSTMQTRFRVAWPQVGLAALLLVGVLVTAHGHAGASRVAFYAGLCVIVAGVLLGIVRMLTPGGK